MGILSAHVVGVSLTLLLLAGAGAQAEPVRLTLLAEDNPPFNYLTEAGELQGPSVEVVKALMAQTGFDYELVVMPWRRAFTRTLQVPDTCLFSMNRTAEREKQFKWVGPLFGGGGLAFYRRADDNRAVNGLSDISGHVIISEDAFSVLEDLKAIPSLIVTKAPGEHEAYELFVAGRGDFWLTGELASRQVLKIPERRAKVRRVFHWKDTSLSLGCSLETADDVIEKLNAALDATRAERAEILERHF